MTPGLDDECPMAGVLATKLRESKRELTTQWLGRIANRITLDQNSIFPTEELLDHVPLLIEGVADYVQNPAAEIGVDMPVVAKAMELGTLRHKQGFDAYEILKEYEFLGGILFTFFARVVDEIQEPCENGELMACGFRLYRAVTIIQQSTMGHFLLLRQERFRARGEASWRQPCHLARDQESNRRGARRQQCPPRNARHRDAEACGTGGDHRQKRARDAEHR